MAREGSSFDCSNAISLGQVCRAVGYFFHPKVIATRPEWASLVKVFLSPPAWFSISILPIILINIVTNQYWRVLANISIFIILARIFLAPLKNFLHCNTIYIVIIIMASNAGLLLFISILNSLNIEELLNS